MIMEVEEDEGRGPRLEVMVNRRARKISFSNYEPIQVGTGNQAQDPENLKEDTIEDFPKETNCEWGEFDSLFLKTNVEGKTLMQTALSMQDSKPKT